MKHSSLLSWTYILSMMVALLAGLLLFLKSTRSDLSTALVAIGLDIARADLVAALLIASASALVEALFSQSRSGAIAGCSEMGRVDHNPSGRALAFRGENLGVAASVAKNPRCHTSRSAGQPRFRQEMAPSAVGNAASAAVGREA